MERVRQASLRRHLTKDRKVVREKATWISGRGASTRKNKSRGLEVGSHLVCSNNSTEASVAGLEGAEVEARPCWALKAAVRTLALSQ